MNTAIKTIGQYIKLFPKDLQVTLQSMRVVINKTIPNGEEAIAYGMPTFRFGGKNLVHFAAYKTHIGFYPSPSGISAFKDELAGYSISKGCIRFLAGKPVPLMLISKITKFRVREDLGKEKTVSQKSANELPHVSAPAMRAFASAKIKNLKDLSKWTEKDLLALHGVGPSAIPALKKALKEHKLSFKK